MNATAEKTEAKRLAYGLDEIAAMTGLSVAFLRKASTDGLLKTKKFGARRLVLIDELDNFINGGEKNEEK